ncbi:MAG: Mu transposase C-terminal domain-containing protein [Actinomycetota bacterium]|nr:Mu transposase C-terminal domain-containing protein [Actinomycetota bacterium]
MSVRPSVALSVGAWLEHDGSTWRVVALDGVAVLLQDRRGRERQLLVEYLLTHPSTMPVTDSGHGPLEALGPTVDVGDELIADVEERAAHLREVATGFRSGNPETALSGEPRPDYQPDRPLMARYDSKAAELGVGVRTLRRWAADFEQAGEVGLLDGRSDRRCNPLAGLDPRWLAVCREVLGEHTEASTPTKALVLDRVEARLEERFGLGVVAAPGRTKAYQVLSELSRGRNTFAGSSKGRRSIAGRPAGSYGRLVATRPGEYLLLDTTPLDVFAMEPVTLRWVRTELTVAFDLYSRCVAGIRLTPYSTKAVDASGVVYDSLRPKLCDPSWGPEARWPYVGVPAALVVDADQLADNQALAGMPVLAPETLVVDHGKIYLSTLLKAVCGRMGISIQPARPLTPTDKAPIERFFRTLREGLLAALPGYKGPDVYSRGADVESQAFFFIDELDGIIREWVASVYHRRPHEGLCVPELPGAELSPNDMFSYGVQRCGFVHIPARPDMAFDFLAVEWRHVHHYGIELGGLRYNGPALDAYRQVTSPYVGNHRGKWPFRIDSADMSRVWFQDPNDNNWHAVEWEHAGAVGAPFSKDALVYAKRLALQRDRFPDVRRTLRELLERWDAGLAHSPTERRASLRMSQERAGLLGPRPETSDNPAAALATIRALFPDGQAPDLERHIDSDPSRPMGGDDDDDDEDLDDVSDDDYYADAFPVFE